MYSSKMCGNATFREIHIRIEYWHLLAAICQEDKKKNKLCHYSFQYFVGGILSNIL